MRTVRHVSNVEVMFGGEEHSGWLPPGASTPRPTDTSCAHIDFRIEEQDPENYLLVWSSRDTGHAGDTWHRSLTEAVAQAEASFGVSPDDWREGPAREKAGK